MALFFKVPTQSGNSGQTGAPSVALGRVALAIVLLIALAVGAVLLQTRLPAASASLWTCFELLFAAIIGLFGFESTKYA